MSLVLGFDYTGWGDHLPMLSGLRNHSQWALRVLIYADQAIIWKLSARVNENKGAVGQ